MIAPIFNSVDLWLKLGLFLLNPTESVWGTKTPSSCLKNGLMEHLPSSVVVLTDIIKDATTTVLLFSDVYKGKSVLITSISRDSSKLFLF